MSSKGYRATGNATPGEIWNGAGRKLQVASIGHLELVAVPEVEEHGAAGDSRLERPPGIESKLPRKLTLRRVQNEGRGLNRSWAKLRLKS